MMQDVAEKISQYIAAFGAWPPLVFGMSDETLERLIDRALKRGYPITEEEQEEHLPPGALA